MSALEQFCAALREAGACLISGRGSRAGFLPPWSGATVSTSSLSGIIAHDVDDQVVEVWAGTPVSELQHELARHGQCLPLAGSGDLPAVVEGGGGTVGGMLAMNLPHGLWAQCGGPRDWTLGARVVRTDGTVAKSGSKAVKSVAGYDAHKLFIGSRGTLGAIASAVLRTLPSKALPRHEVDPRQPCDGACFVVRCLATDFEAAVERARSVVAADRRSCTIWCLEEPEVPEHGWMVGPGGVRSRPPQPLKYERRAGEVFDPARKLAPGWKE